MLDYSNFPPIETFLKVLKRCPQTALLFVDLWREKDQTGHLTIEKTNVRNLYHISPTLFRNHCLDLSDEEILQIDENHLYFLVDLYVE